MRGKKRGFRRKKNQLLKRAISILAILVLCITGMDLSALGQVFAEETSGYKLEVEYSQDYSSAVIKGDSSGVGQNIQLAELSDESGQTYAVEEFQYSVEENGEYNFNLTYYENVDGNLTEKEESLKVEVNDIVKIESEDNSSSAQVTSETEVVCQETEEEQEEAADTVLEGEGQDNEVQEKNNGETVAEQSLENQQEEDEDQESDSDFPDTLPIETLKANAEQLMAADTGGSRIATLDATEDTDSNTTITVTAVTRENQIVLTEVGENGQFAFEGGVFSEETVSIKTYNEQRIFYRALYVLDGVQFEIAALYPYENTSGNVEWYYVPGAIDGNGAVVDESQISVGYLLPEGADIWVEYGVDENAKSYNITVSGTDITSTEETGYWKVSVPSTAKHKEKVVLEFNLPSAYAGATVKIRSKSNNSTVYQSFSTEDNSLTSVDSNTARYSGVFDMPDADVDIYIEAIVYTEGVTRYYGLGLDGADINILSNTTYTVDVSMEGLTGSTPTVDWECVKYPSNTNSGYNTSPTYTNGSGVTDYVTKDYYDVYGGSTNLNVAWGRFTIGEDVKFNISYGMYMNDGSYNNPTALSRKVPMFLRIDSYPNTVSGSEEVCEVVELPGESGATTSQTLSSGAVVTITCTGYRTSGSLDNQGTVSWDKGYKTSGNSYFNYSVTISNMKYAFKAYINSDAELSQTSMLLDIDEDSIVIGSGTCTAASTTQNQDMSEFLAGQVSSGASSFSGSFWVGDKTEQYKSRYIYPVTTAQSIWAKYGVKPDLTGSSSGYLEFYFQVKEGYSQPTVNTSGGTLTYQGTRNGYFYYTYNFGGSYPGLINVSAEPITFNMTYRDGKGNTVFTDEGYTPATTVDYVIKNVLLDSPDSNGKYFQGWRIEYKAHSTDSENQVIDDTIYNSGDVLNLQDIYAKMLEAGYITDATEYDIFIVGVWGDREEGSQVQATYSVSKQTTTSSTTGGAFAIDYTSKPASISELQSIYTAENFETTTSSVVAYEGTTARLTGYEAQMEDENGKKYLLSPDSIADGVISGNTTFAQLVYMSAVNVQFTTDADSYGSGNEFGTTTEEINAYNESIADRYYIPAEYYTIYGGLANNSSKGIRIWAFELYNDDGTAIYNPGEMDGKTFSGWRVKTSTDTEWVINGGNIKWLNIYNIATQAPELWAEVVEAGTIVLEPVWEDDIGKITAHNSEDLVQTTPESHSVTTSTEYSISNTFSYTGKWDAAGFSYALRKDNGDGTYDVWYSYVDGAEGTKKTGVTAEVSNDDEAKTVTVTITIPAELVSKANLQDQTLSLSAWNSANGVTNKEMATSALGMAAKVNNVFTTSPQAITLVSQKTQSIETPERKGYQITAQFTYDPLYYSMDDLKDTVEGLSYAVYYQTKDGNVIKKWTKEDGGIAVIDNSTGPALTYYAPDRINGLLTLKFWVGSAADQTGDLNSGGVDMQHDNSHYYIACWNTTNGNYSIDDVLNEIKAGTSTSVPCTDITTHVTWRDPDFYVTIPATIMLEDGNGKSDDYAGKKVQISFSSNTSTESSEYKVPSISVAVQGEITLTNDSGESREVLVCRSDGTEISPSSGNYDIGTLAYNNRSIEVWLNTLKGNKRGEKWTGIATFTLTNTSKYPEASTVSENTDVAINTDD